MKLAEFSPIAAIATTANSARRLGQLRQIADVTLWVPPSVTDIPHAQIYTIPLKEHIATLWSHHRALVFGLATGAVVRLIAPLLQDKSIDPAVVVVDEAGKFAVSLCSGHQGGADRLTQSIARQLGATPVLTGASASLGLPAVDLLGVPFGWTKGTGDWTGVSAAVARGETVEVFQDAGWELNLPHPAFAIQNLRSCSDPQGVSPDSIDPNSPKTDLKGRIWISFTQRQFSPESPLPKVQWHPRVLWVGVGCERGTPRSAIEDAIARVFRANHLAEGSIAGIATIALKADEVGLLELCGDRHLPLVTFSPEQLRDIEVPNPSEVVDREVGTPSVAEAAAIFAASSDSLQFRPPLVPARGETTRPLSSEERVRERWERDGGQLLVPKQIYKPENQPGAVTVAVAVASREYTGRDGKLWLVGTGPGCLEQMTPAAQDAIARADAIVGYSLYINLVRPLLQPQQIIEALPITQERQRAQRAIDLAQWGLTVAVISSGDCGIYGMGGLVLEELQARNWDGKTPSLQVFPGISALQSAASRVGTPLMHDFCSISLSDLLTPWEVIEKRLNAAAAADFVVALYNPKSQNRTEQIAIARRIFLEHRSPQTPVALVRSAYRDDERVMLTTLDRFLEFEVDMLTTVLIGNTQTRSYENWMITPRGYY
ncbi:MAG TPA: precorrin-3B C(17)-methyltransferase [Oscillatoriales cyanobacterium M59_W2019_021]|nr:precorrin-3B C(17)-methyltransferase [Oscillatoriales cyanobacterium M59_W2019_021]